jgi:hypothetical protein
VTLTYIQSHFVFSQVFLWIQEKLNKKKENEDETTDYKKITFPILILKKMKSPVSILIFLFVVYLLEIFMYSILLAFGEFKCKKSIIGFGAIIQGFSFAMAATAYFIAQLLDIFMNFKLFLKCKFRQYYIDDDVFFFRIETILCIIFVPPGIVWALVPMPQLLQVFLVEILVLLFLTLIGGVLALGITMYRYFFPPKKNEFKNEIDEIFSNEKLYQLFYDYAKVEFSIENVLWRVDSTQYSKQKNEKKRLKLAQQMVIKYLSGDNSSMEINANAKVIKPIVQKVKNGEVPMDLFASLDKIVSTNLSDTYGRFSVSRPLKNFKRRNFQSENAVGDRSNSVYSKE